MLPFLSPTTSGAARRTVFFLSAIAIAALALPTLKWATHAQLAGPGVVNADDAAQPAGAAAAVDRGEKSRMEQQDEVVVPEIEYLPRPSKFEEQVLAALEKPVDVEFSTMPLEDCIGFLGKESKIPMWLDKTALTEGGVALDQPITLQLKVTRLESVLNLLLHPAELEYIPENEVLMITTSTKAGEKMITRTYPVRDLVKMAKLPGDESTDDKSTGTRPEVPANTGGEKGPAPSDAKPAETTPSTGPANQVLKQGFGGGGMGGGMMGGGMGMGGMGGGGRGGGAGGGRSAAPRDGLDFTSLMNLISTTIQPDSWEDLSGPGSMMQHRITSSLVIRQTWAVHREVQQLLRSLREAKRLAPSGKGHGTDVDRK